MLWKIGFVEDAACHVHDGTAVPLRYAVLLWRVRRAELLDDACRLGVLAEIPCILPRCPCVDAPDEAREG